MMNATQIASAHILDIVFDGRNKEYGAYQLYRHYNQRLLTALSAVIGLVLATFLISGQKPAGESATIINIPADTLQLVKPVDPPEKTPEPLVEERIQSVKNTTIVIVDSTVKVTDTIPTVDDIDNAISATFNQTGRPADGDVPVERPVEITKAPVAEVVEPNAVLDFAEFPAAFPGGPDAWRHYLEKSLNYPEQAIETGKEGTVRVQFIVDKEGNISDVRAINDPGDGLAEEAIRIIKRGPRWKPAEQNGRKVIFRTFQSITFKLQ